MQQQDYMLQQPSYTQSIQSGGDVVENNAPSLGKTFKSADGKRLGDIEEAKENKRQQRRSPAKRAAQQRDPLTGHFIDDDKAGVVTAAFARCDCGCRYAEDDREGDTAE